MLKSSRPTSCCCLAIVGFLGLFSLITPSESPEQAIKTFAKVFMAGDAAGLMKMIHPDIISGKEIRKEKVESFVRGFSSGLKGLKSHNVKKELVSEDGKTKRFEATLVFEGPTFSPHYSEPSSLEMTLLWVFDEKHWWLERPLSMDYKVASSKTYPTSTQDDLAARFQTAVDILEKLGLPGDEVLAITGSPKPGVAVDIYKGLEKQYVKEKSEKGIDPNAYGVSDFLKGAAKAKGGFLTEYRGDFQTGGRDKSRALPWEMFADYGAAAIKRGKAYQARGDHANAAATYKLVISFGRQLLAEPGGLQFALWGLRFQWAGGQGLAKVVTKSGKVGTKDVEAFVSLTSRRLDLYQTALGCLDDLADYNSLKAAMLASQRVGDVNFRPWGINTLAILAFKGAPADPEVLKQAPTMIYVINPAMQKQAQDALDKLASGPSDPIRVFISHQKDWVRKHKVYGAAASF